MKQDIFEAILDSVHRAVIATNTKGYIIHISEAARLLLGYEMEIVLNTTNYSDVDFDGWSVIKKVLETGRQQIPIYIERQKQSILINALPIIIGGEIQGAVGIFQLIDQHGKMIDQFKKNDELVRQIDAIIESSYDGIYVTDGKANTIRINSAYEKITGMKASDLIGRNMRDLVSDGIVSESVTLKVLESKGVVTLSPTMKTGKRVLVTGNPIFDTEGKINMVVTNVRDITDLIELNDKLERATLMTLAYKKELQALQWSKTEDSRFISVSEIMKPIHEMVDHISGTSATVFLYGETGVGKDRIAEEIHNRASIFRKGLLVKINCGAIPETLLESELFGYEKGAFTGAKKEGKAGLFEVADGGTLFLDEIEAMTLIVQSKLLRVVQNFEITRLGSTSVKKVDVRLICASNQDLKKLVEKNMFREDLYYRLNVIPIFIPPLRERTEDIELLANFFLNRFNCRNSKRKILSKETMILLKKYSWPGNVRELENLIERLVVITKDDCIMPQNLPMEFHKRDFFPGTFTSVTLKKHMEQVEKVFITNAIKIYGNARKASHHLGLDPSTLTRKIKRYKQSDVN